MRTTNKSVKHSSPVVEKEVKASTNAGSSENEKLKSKKKKANRNGKSWH